MATKETTGVRNMYGCLPCPKCKSVYRAPYKRDCVEDDDCIIECDCGFNEPGRFSDRGYVVDARPTPAATPEKVES